MTTLTNRPNSALLVIDVQNGVVSNALGRDQVIENINAMLVKARAADIPVVWVQHSDEEMPINSDDWQIVSELVPAAGEARIEKLYRSSFVATDLEQKLTDLGVSHLYLTGAETNNCMRHTMHTALESGYDITLVSDAHTTTGYTWNGHTVDAANVIAEQNDNLSHYDLPGQTARALPSTAIEF